MVDSNHTEFWINLEWDGRGGPHIWEFQLIQVYFDKFACGKLLFLCLCICMWTRE